MPYININAFSYTVSFDLNNYFVKMILLHILQMKTLKFKEIKQLTYNTFITESRLTCRSGFSMLVLHNKILQLPFACSLTITYIIQHANHVHYFDELRVYDHEQPSRMDKECRVSSACILYI
jgi:HJR/Mrr/RecB family endonuclease